MGLGGALYLFSSFRTWQSRFARRGSDARTNLYVVLAASGKLEHGSVPVIR